MARAAERGVAHLSHAALRRIAAVALLFGACTKDAPKLLPWQERASTLPAAEREVLRGLREGLGGLEGHRIAQKKWPEPLGLPPGLHWSKLERSSYVNYLGAPEEGRAARRWLVLIIEPEAGLLKQAHEPVVKTDDEHHVLPDGTLLHVTFWSQPNAGALPFVPLPLPGEDGWTESVGR